MKATIDVNGMLKVKAENGIEAYALTKWAEENIGKTQNLEVWYCLDDIRENENTKTFGITSKLKNNETNSL